MANKLKYFQDENNSDYLYDLFFALTFASPLSIIDSSSIIDNLSQSLYTRLNPIFQSTFQQLTQLVFEFSGKLSQIIDDRSSRSDPVKPADWIFFTNIPTVLEKDSRSLLDFSLVKTKLHVALEKLLIKLKELFDKNINELLASIINEFNLKSNGRRHDEINALLNDFQRQISGVFDKTKEQLNRTSDDLIGSILSYWNNLKNRFFG